MKRKKEYTQMTTEELREATREFDVPCVRLPGKPLTKAQSARFEAARRAKPMEEILRPIREAFEASGMSDDELSEMLLKAKKQMRADRKK